MRRNRAGSRKEAKESGDEQEKLKIGREAGSGSWKSSGKDRGFSVLLSIISLTMYA